MDGRLAVRAREAPTHPGVYVMLGPRGELLYVGKAASLRRRLLDHARGTSARSRALAEHVQDVRWIACADEREALMREADLVAALAPPFNAVMSEEAFTYVRVPDEGAALRFGLRAEPDSRTYGAFPHLGKGKHSWRAVRTNAGYSALLRLLWAAFAPTPERIPARLRGSSPPLDHAMLAEGLPRSMLHDLMSGVSARLLQVVHFDSVPGSMRGSLGDDLAAAKGFFELGPRALRQLRLRHGSPSGPLAPETFRALVADELRAEIGPFELPPRLEHAGLVGRRTAFALRARNARRATGAGWKDS